MPEDVKKILAKLNKWGYEAYIVGGCVRDYLMGINPSDWDITMSATPDQAKAIFRKTVDTGIEHGTITVVINRENYELTTYRIDGEYLDNRRPSNVMFSNSLTEDLSRRDFTINSIAYSDIDGIRDPFEGIDDIKSGIIKCVGNADCRFKEDALRMLRALRFSAQLGFSIENETYTAILNNAPLIKNISIERVRDEFRKILMSDRPEYVRLLADTGLSKYLDGILNEHLSMRPNSISLLPFSSRYLPIRLAVLFVEMPEAALAKTLKYLSFENAVIKTATLLAKWALTHIENDYYSVRKAVKEIGTDEFLNVFEIKKLLDVKNIPVYDEIISKQQVILINGDCVSLKDLKIDGNVLKGMGVTDGRKIGNILEFLLDDVFKNPDLNTSEKLKERAKQYI